MSAALQNHRPAGLSQDILLRLLALLLWIAALAWLSLVPKVEIPPGPWGCDKFDHFAAYAVLAFLLIRVLHARCAAANRMLATAWSACFAYGALLEGLQWLMGLGRQWEVGDLLANGLGALAACVVFRLAKGRYLPANGP